MKIRATLLILCVMFSVNPAFCQEPANPSSGKNSTVTTVAGLPQTQPVVEQPLRDPFWPVGYEPQNKGNDIPSTTTVSNKQTRLVVTLPGKTNIATVVQETIVRWPELKVKGLTKQLDGSYLAIIEGVKNIVEAGQTVQIIRDGIIFRWKITEITKKGIIQQKLDSKPTGR